MVYAGTTEQEARYLFSVWAGYTTRDGFLAADVLYYCIVSPLLQHCGLQAAVLAKQWKR